MESWKQRTYASVLACNLQLVHLTITMYVCMYVYFSNILKFKFNSHQITLQLQVLIYSLKWVKLNSEYVFAFCPETTMSEITEFGYLFDCWYIFQRDGLIHS